MGAGSNISPEQLHETGRPDTPIEALTEILTKATKEEDISALRSLVQDAYNLTAGLDPYLEKISTPPSKVTYSFLLSRPRGSLQQYIYPAPGVTPSRHLAS